MKHNHICWTKCLVSSAAKLLYTVIPPRGGIKFRLLCLLCLISNIGLAMQVLSQWKKLPRCQFPCRQFPTVRVGFFVQDLIASLGDMLKPRVLRLVSNFCRTSRTQSHTLQVWTLSESVNWGFRAASKTQLDRSWVYLCIRTKFQLDSISLRPYRTFSLGWNEWM